MKRTPIRKKAKTQSWYRKKCVIEAKRIALTRDNYTCQRCGRTKEGGTPIHGSHVYPEGRYTSMSADPENIKALCYLDHLMWWHKHPTESGLWFKEKFPERHANLRKKAQITKQTDWQKELEKLKAL